MRTDKKKAYDKIEPKYEEFDETNNQLRTAVLIALVLLLLLVLFIIIHIITKGNTTSKSIKKVIVKKINKGKLMCKTQEPKIENILLNLGAGGDKENISFFSRGPDKNGISYCTMAYTTFNHIYYADYVTNGTRLKIFRKGVVQPLSASYLRWHRYFKDFHFNKIRK